MDEDIEGARALVDGRVVIEDVEGIPRYMQVLVYMFDRLPDERRRLLRIMEMETQ